MAINILVLCGLASLFLPIDKYILRYIMPPKNGTRLNSPRILGFKPNIFLRGKYTTTTRMSPRTTTTATTTSTASTTTSTSAMINISETKDLFVDSQTNNANPLGPRVIVPGIDPVTKTGVNANGTDIFELCAPFPSCDPIGCEDPTIAAINCPQCNSAATGAIIFGMLLLSLFIIGVNLLVIRIILQTTSLRRRHGYIKLSMATSDLLVGIFVVPSAIANLVTSLYHPYQTPDDVITNGEMTFEEKVDRLLQVNTTTSVVFGTIVVLGVTTSLYNLLLLSADRFLAVARPLKHRAGSYGTKKSLWFSIAAVWIFGVSLSIVPGFFPAYFRYQMDPTTFFFIQQIGKVNSSEENTHTFAPYYITIIIGGPYFATVLLNILTAFYTWRSAKVRHRLSGRGNMTKSAAERKCERSRRVKMLKDAYPEAMMDDETTTSSSSSKFKAIFKKDTPSHRQKRGRRATDEGEKQGWLSWWRGDDDVAKFNCSSSNNNSTDSEGAQQPSQSPRFQRTRDQIQIVRDLLNPTNARNIAKEIRTNYKTHVRVFKMLIAMVAAFSVCLLPYVIVTLKIGSMEQSELCGWVATPYSFALYMLILNSASNFIIYNLWHPEFRQNLIKTFRRDVSKTAGMGRRASSFFVMTSQKGTESTLTTST